MSRWPTFRLSVLAVLCAGVCCRAGLRLALVSSQRSERADQVLALSEAQLSAEPELELLDRTHTQRLIEEHKLSAGGLLDPQRALAAGELLTTDLFAVVEAPAGTEQVIGLIVYDTRTGVRLCDVTLPPGASEETVTALVEGVRLALRKQRLMAVEAWTLCVVGVRNADLPRTYDPWCRALAGLLERRLLQGPTVTLLERSHLAHINRERNLTGSPVADRLLASLAPITVELSRGDHREEVQAVAAVSDAAGRRLHQVTARTRGSAPGALAEALADAILAALAQPLPPQPPDRGRETQRFHHEAQVLLGNACYDQAVPAAEAALALSPDDPGIEGTLTGALAEYARSLLDRAATTPGGPRRYTEAAAPTIEEAAEQALRAVELTQQAFQRAAAQRRLEPMYANARCHARFRTALVPLARELAAARQEVPTVAVVDGFTALGQAWIDSCDEIVRGWQTIIEAGQPNPFVPFWDGLTRDQFQILASLSPDGKRYTEAKVRFCDAWIRSLAAHFDETQVFIAMDNFARTAATALGAAELWALQPDDWQKTSAFLESVQGLHPHPAFLYAGLLGRGRVAEASHRPLSPGYAADLQRLRTTLKAYLRAPGYTPANRDANRFRRMGLYDAYFGSVEWPWTGETDALRDAAVREMVAYMRQQDEAVQSALAHTERLQQAGEARWPEIIAELHATEDWLKDPRVKVLDWDRHSFGQRIDAIRRPLLAKRPDLAPHRAGTPWQDVRKLLGVEQLGADGRLCFPRLDPQGRVLVLAVLYNRPDGQAYRLLRLPAEGGPPECLNAAPPLLRTTVEGHHRVSVCVDAHCFYLGSPDEGVLALPLDGTPPRQFNTASGLPSNAVTALAALEGRLYVGTGGYQQDGLFLTLDLKHDDVSVLASSRRTFRQSPFDDSGPFYVAQMVADPAKRRLLLFMQVSPTGTAGRDPRHGLWEYVPATNAFRQLASFATVNNPEFSNPVWGTLDREGHFLFGVQWLQALGTQDDRLTWVVNNFSQGRDVRLNAADNLIHRHLTLCEPFVLEPDAVWSYYPLGRVSPTTQVFEEFQRPSDVATRHGWVPLPQRCLQALGDGYRYLYGDGEALWVLSTGTPQPQGGQP